MPINEVNFRWKMKVKALTLDVPWHPKVGDYCTQRDALLELNRVEEITAEALSLRPVFDPVRTTSPVFYVRDPGDLAWVPGFVLGTSERDRPRIVAEAIRAKPTKPKAGKAAGKDS